MSDARLDALLAALTWKASLVVVVAGIACWILRRRSAAVRHGVWMYAVASLVLLPILAIGLPRWRVVVQTRTVLEGPEADVARSRGVAALVPDRGAPLRASSVRASTVRRLPPSPPLDLRVEASACWIIGVALAWLWMIWSAARLRASASRAGAAGGRIEHRVQHLAVRLGIRRSIRVLMARADTIPATWGFARPTILLPLGAERWSEARLDAVVMHELIHVARGDALVHLVALAAWRLYWLNPFVWLAVRELGRECELACDERVVGAGIPAFTYAEELVALARSYAHAPSLATQTFVARGGLEARIRAILSPHRSAAPLSVRGAIQCTTVCTCAVMGVAMIDPTTARRIASRPRHTIGAVQLTDLGAAVQPPHKRALSPTVDDAESRAIEPASPALNLDSLPPKLTPERVAVAIDATPPPIYLERASDSSPELRLRAAWALHGRGRDAVPVLVHALLTDTDAGVRETAAWALGGVRDEAALQALVASATHDSDARTRESAFRSLVDAGSSDAALPAITSAVEDPVKSIRYRALWYIGAHGLDAFVPQLLAALGDPDRGVRIVAGWSLGVLRPPGHAAAAIRLLADPDPDVKQAALWMLLRLDDAESRAAIRSARTDPSPRVQLLAARADKGEWTAWTWTMPDPRPRPAP